MPELFTGARGRPRSRAFPSRGRGSGSVRRRLQRQLLARQRLLQVLRRDLRSRPEYRQALQGRDVDQHATGDELTDASSTPSVANPVRDSLPSIGMQS